VANDRPLAGQRILYVGVGYFSYDRIIASGLRDLGAEVVAVAERPPLLLRSHLSSPINMIAALRNRVQRRHESRLKAQLAGQTFETVLVVKGDSLDIGFFDHLRAANPDARFVLYQWDAVKLVRGFASLRARFDRCVTFDRHDAAADKSLIFRPLFYTKSADTPSPRPKGLIFVGTLHSKRLHLARTIKARAEAQGLPVSIYVRVGLFNFIRLFIMGNLRDVHYHPLAYEKYIAWTQEAEAVMDFPHPQQSGLTMRTAEAIGLSKKIITTNKDIMNYPFYDPRNILVVDDENPIIPEGFLSGAPAHYSSLTMQQFSLRQWLCDVLDIDRETDVDADSGEALTR